MNKEPINKISKFDLLTSKEDATHTNIQINKIINKFHSVNLLKLDKLQTLQNSFLQKNKKSAENNNDQSKFQENQEKIQNLDLQLKNIKQEIVQEQIKNDQLISDSQKCKQTISKLKNKINSINHKLQTYENWFNHSQNSSKNLFQKLNIIQQRLNIQSKNLLQSSQKQEQDIEDQNQFKKKTKQQINDTNQQNSNNAQFIKNQKALIQNQYQTIQQLQEKLDKIYLRRKKTDFLCSNFEIFLFFHQFKNLNQIEIDNFDMNQVLIMQRKKHYQIDDVQKMESTLQNYCKDGFDGLIKTVLEFLKNLISEYRFQENLKSLLTSQVTNQNILLKFDQQVQKIQLSELQNKKFVQEFLQNEDIQKLKQISIQTLHQNPSLLQDHYEILQNVQSQMKIKIQQNDIQNLIIFNVYNVSLKKIVTYLELLIKNKKIHQKLKIVFRNILQYLEDSNICKFINKNQMKHSLTCMDILGVFKSIFKIDKNEVDEVKKQFHNYQFLNFIHLSKLKTFLQDKKNLFQAIQQIPVFKQEVQFGLLVDFKFYMNFYENLKSNLSTIFQSKSDTFNESFDDTSQNSNRDDYKAKAFKQNNVDFLNDEIKITINPYKNQTDTTQMKIKDILNEANKFTTLQKQYNKYQNKQRIRELKKEIFPEFKTQIVKNVKKERILYSFKDLEAGNIFSKKEYQEGQENIDSNQFKQNIIDQKQQQKVQQTDNTNQNIINSDIKDQIYIRNEFKSIQRQCAEQTLKDQKNKTFQNDNSFKRNIIFDNSKSLFFQRKMVSRSYKNDNQIKTVQQQLNLTKSTTNLNKQQLNLIKIKNQYKIKQEVYQDNENVQQMTYNQLYNLQRSSKQDKSPYLNQIQKSTQSFHK